MENIKEYLKYYVGQKCMVMTRSGERETEITLFAIGRSDVKPILKKLSDMSEEDVKGFFKLRNSFPKKAKIAEYKCDHLMVDVSYLLDGQYRFCHQYFTDLNADQFHHLISKGYWLWDEEAFTSGLILDAKNVK